jgi:hypothetical protein
VTTVDLATAPEPPEGDRYTAARWMVDRNPSLSRLLGRVPNFIDRDGDPDVDLLAETINEYEQYVASWTVYEQRFPAPADDDRFETWREAGPQPTALVGAISVMSPTERARLRMLATFSRSRVPTSVLDFGSLDDSGRALLTDWTIAVRAS